MSNIRQHIPAIFGTATSTAGAMASWLENLDRVLSIGASAVAIVAGLLTIRSILRKPNKH